MTPSPRSTLAWLVLLLVGSHFFLQASHYQPWAWIAIACVIITQLYAVYYANKSYQQLIEQNRTRIINHEFTADEATRDPRDGTPFKPSTDNWE